MLHTLSALVLLLCISQTTITMTLAMNSCGYVCALFSNDELLSYITSVVDNGPHTTVNESCRLSTDNAWKVL